ncbi:HNH endonuclease [Microlunatus elymi]|uniref:HNH endonuclease n=1 Tax=Microlunatus elymi TaxID=2596828 RepID=A0A516Q4F3_9ACTN|nr:HNH endonuclease [Microlunatus elymi]
MDAAVADYVGRSAWGQVLRLLDAKIIEIDAERIAKLAEEYRNEFGVWLGQATEHGAKTLFVRGEAPDLIWFDAMVDRIADILGTRGDTRSKGLRRAAAVGILANPLHALRLLAEDDAPSLFDPDLEGVEDLSGVDLGPAGETEGPGMQPEGPELVEGPGRQAEDDHPVRFPRIDQDRVLARAMVAAIGRLDPARMRPDATLYVHIAKETLESGLGVARVEDIGPVVSSLVADWLGRCDVTVKPVIDLNAELTPVDAYEGPRAMRERMFLKRPTSVFPFSSSRGQGLDLDHSDPYRDGVPGQTREDNLAPLSRSEHNLITRGLWNRRQPEPGTFLFRAPHGRVLLVNQTGTHDLGDSRFADQIWHCAAPQQS